MKNPAVLSTAAALLALSLSFTPARAADNGTSSAINYDDMIVGGLPLPFGVSVHYLWQQQDYEVTGLRAIASGAPVPGFGPSVITDLENDADEINAKFDWWALPWLNFHAILGHVSGEANASLSPALWPLLGGTRGFQVDYNGLVYGGGLTVAAGYKNFFGSLTANYTWGDVDLKDGSGLSLVDPNGIETLVVTPKVGLRFEKGAVWVGAYYQYTEHTQTGSFRLPPPIGSVQFQADVEDENPWSCVVGGQYEITPHWVLMAEIGFGGRQQVLLGTTYRF